MTIFAWFVALTLRVTVVLVASIALGVLLRGAGAASRHRLFTLTAISLLALPLLTALVPRWELPLLPRWTQQVSSSAPFAPSGAAGPIEALGAVEPAAQPPSIAGPAASTLAADGLDATSEWRWGPLAVGLWLVGVLGHLVGLSHGLRRESRLVAASRPLDSGWRETLEEARQEARGPRAGPPVDERRDRDTLDLRLVAALGPAAVIGPCLARGAAKGSPAHQLVHVLRVDVLRHLLWRLACALYWFHPMVRAAAGRASGAREEACDEAVLDLGNRPSAYARHLLEIAESLRVEARLPSLALSMIERGQLERRLHVILDPRSGPRLPGACVRVLPSPRSAESCSASRPPRPRRGRWRPLPSPQLRPWPPWPQRPPRPRRPPRAPRPRRPPSRPASRASTATSTARSTKGLRERT